MLQNFFGPTVWPSGLRRWLKAPVRKGVGSNPTAVTDVFLFVAQQGFFDLILRARAGKVAGVFALLLQLGGGFFDFFGHWCTFASGRPAGQFGRVV